MKKLKEKLSAKLKKSGGFTLVEMLIVVAIIAILIAVSIPMIGANLEKAREATDTANERSAMSMSETFFLLNSTDMTFEGGNATTPGTCKLYYEIDQKTHQGKIVESVTSDDNFKYGLSKAERTVVGTEAGKPEGNGVIITINSDGDITGLKWGTKN